MIRKILCASDFSEPSTKALHAAARLATERDAELVIAHVWYVPPFAFAGEQPYPVDAVDSMISDGERMLADAAREAVQLGAKRVTTTFVHGVPWDRIVETVRDDPAYDLIVVGTQGRTGFARMLLGSTTEKVVRHAPCSVLAVRAPERSGRYARVLCPVDFSDSSRRAMQVAGELVARRDAQLTLLHVVDVPPAYTHDPALVSYLASMEKLATQTLADWAGELRAKLDVPVVTRTAIGSPIARALATLEAEQGFDLVVVGSHGRTGLRRMLLGSVAEQLVRHAGCDVLVVRSRAP